MKNSLALAEPVSLPVIRRIEPLVSLRIETSQYVAKTVDELEEFEAALGLRAQIFSEEYGAALASARFDIDEYDFKADHLVIVEKASGQVVGTYRLLSSRFTRRFYSESEFDLSTFLAEPGMKLELGRACVAAEHRRGSVLNLLWRAVIQYAFQTQARYLFGCSSVKTTCALETAALMDELRRQAVHTDDWPVRPLEKFRFPPLTGLPPAGPSEDGSPDTRIVSIPPLFRSYLKAGARVVGQPALDRDFRCVDFLTVLRLSDLAQTFGNRYKYELDV